MQTATISAPLNGKVSTPELTLDALAESSYDELAALYAKAKNAKTMHAVDGAPKYVNFYTTENIAALDSAPYYARLDNPTPWSAHHSPRFKNYTRVVARVTGSKGQGRGGALAFARIRPPGNGREALRNSILAQFDALIGIDGVISAHLLEAEAADLAAAKAPCPCQRPSAARVAALSSNQQPSGRARLPHLSLSPGVATRREGRPCELGPARERA